MIEQATVIDIGKTVLQLVATAAIAWFTVKAALNRFKAERTWERRLDSYTGLLTAVRRVQVELGRWQDGMEGHNAMTEIEMPKRLEIAQDQFEHAFAVAEMLLPSEMLSSLRSLSLALDDIQGHRPWHRVNKAYGVTEELLRELRSAGRDAFQ